MQVFSLRYKVITLRLKYLSPKTIFLTSFQITLYIQTTKKKLPVFKLIAIKPYNIQPDNKQTEPVDPYFC